MKKQHGQGPFLTSEPGLRAASADYRDDFFDPQTRSLTPMRAKDEIATGISRTRPQAIDSGPPGLQAVRTLSMGLSPRIAARPPHHRLTLRQQMPLSVSETIRTSP